MAFCIYCSNRFSSSFTCSCNLQGYRFSLFDRIHLPQMTNWHVFNKLLTVVWSELVIFIYVVNILILGLKALKILAISSTKVWYNIWFRKLLLTGLSFKHFPGLDNWKKNRQIVFWSNKAWVTTFNTKISKINKHCFDVIVKWMGRLAFALQIDKQYYVHKVVKFIKSQENSDYWETNSFTVLLSLSLTEYRVVPWYITFHISGSQVYSCISSRK